MSSSINEAAWLGGPNGPLSISNAPMPVPGVGEIVVRTRALALNPFDGMVQTLGGLITPWLAYPAVLGSDVAGEVVAVGSSVTRLKPGDRVLGLAIGIDKVANRCAEGAFQRFVLLRQDATTVLPDSLSFEQAAVLPLAVATAACALFLPDQLGLQPPASTRRQAPARTLVVWGGGTSVGNCAIQLAVAAGYEVVTTSSAGNFDRLRTLGAAQVFDRHDPRVVDTMASALRGREIVGAMAVGVGSGRPCLELIGRCQGRKMVAMASPPVPLDDAPLGRQFAWKLRRLPRLGLGFLSLAITARLRGIKTTSIWGTALVQTPLGKSIFVDFLGAALAKGVFVASPQPLVCGHSLHDIPQAMTRLREGVSSQKIVVAL
jgi:NADPH:quinone reductase-like Zn-dependent oxidoreductase